MRRREVVLCSACGANYLASPDGCTRCAMREHSAEQRAEQRRRLGLDLPREDVEVEDLWKSLGLSGPRGAR